MEKERPTKGRTAYISRQMPSGQMPPLGGNKNYQLLDNIIDRTVNLQASPFISLADKEYICSLKSLFIRNV